MEFTKKDLINYLESNDPKAIIFLEKISIEEIKNIFKTQGYFCGTRMNIFWLEKEKIFLKKIRNFGRNAISGKEVNFTELDKLIEKYPYHEKVSQKEYWFNRMLNEIKYSEEPFKIKKNELSYDGIFVNEKFKWNDDYEIIEFNLINKRLGIEYKWKEREGNIDFNKVFEIID